MISSFVVVTMIVYIYLLLIEFLVVQLLLYRFIIYTLENVSETYLIFTLSVHWRHVLFLIYLLIKLAVRSRCWSWLRCHGIFSCNILAYMSHLLQHCILLVGWGGSTCVNKIAVLPMKSQKQIIFDDCMITCLFDCNSVIICTLPTCCGWRHNVFDLLSTRASHNILNAIS